MPEALSHDPSVSNGIIVNDFKFKIMVEICNV